MKKIVTWSVAVLLALGLSGQPAGRMVYASEEGPVINTTGDTTAKVYAKYIKSDDTVYQVDINWGSMVFTYNEGSRGTWDPKTHTYKDDGVEEGWTYEEGANEITVTNHSNATVTVEVEFKPNSSNMEVSFGGDYDTTYTGFLLRTADEYEISDNAMSEPGARTKTLTVVPKKTGRRINIRKDTTEAQVVGELTITLVPGSE